jgi:glucitol operon activator protein
MGLWSVLLAVLGVLWLAQIAGTYLQMRHYRKVLGRIAGEYSEGYIGVGNARSRFGKGVILILVVGEDGEVVRKALRMRGMTVFARFREYPELEGASVEELKAGGVPVDRATLVAAEKAMEQIERIRAEREEGAGASREEQAV